jgi:hypothetical protein
VCLLEEPSAQAMLEGVLPRLLQDKAAVQYIVFEGKQDMEKQIARKLRNWRKPDSVFLVMRDQDASDCADVKKKLKNLCQEAGKPEALVRIACRELESFYFGDLSAVAGVLHTSTLKLRQGKAQYRDPDNIVCPSKELSKLTDGKYQKIGGSREIGKVLSLDENSSHSFNVLLSGIKRICKMRETADVLPPPPELE